MPSLSKVQIGNLALSNVGSKSSIESFEERSTEARRIKQWYDVSRQQVLEAFDWGFARKRQDLALHGDDPPDQWSYRYQYPSGCVAFRRIWNPAGEKERPIPYSMETSSGTKSILTNMEDAVGIFTDDVMDTTLFSSNFNLALSYLIGFYIAMSITGKRTIKKDCWEVYRALIAQAPALDFNQDMQDEPRDADWIAGR